ncbi:hypothetical protein NPIL_48881, partial [Nephila pilipes]
PNAIPMGTRVSSIVPLLCHYDVFPLLALLIGSSPCTWSFYMVRHYLCPLPATCQ